MRPQDVLEQTPNPKQAGTYWGRSRARGPGTNTGPMQRLLSERAGRREDEPQPSLRAGSGTPGPAPLRLDLLAPLQPAGSSGLTRSCTIGCGKNSATSFMACGKCSGA